MTHTEDRGKLVIHERCSLCTLIQKNEQECIRNERTRRIICKNCIKAMNHLNLKIIVNIPDQKELNFG